MSVQLQDRFNEPLIAANFPSYDDIDGGPAQSNTTTSPGGDIISRILNPGALFGQLGTASVGSSSAGGLYAIINQLISIIQQLLGNSAWGNGSGNQAYFSNASGGSSGDPHLSFNGSTWNDMQSVWNLLDSDSVPGGFRISTQTTVPNSTGVTYNQQATVTTNFGTTSVTLERNGNATYTQNGATNTIAPGQTLDLGGGETVARNQNGSLTITNTTPSGGTITTTMTDSGQGVNVSVTATNVDLGGTLVSGNTSNEPSPPTPTPVPQRPVFQRY